VIPEADAVHDPRTMVIHLQNARLANPAVVTPIGFVDEAMLATPPFTRELHLLGDIRILEGAESPGFPLWHVSRHGQRGPKETHQEQCNEHLCDNKMTPATFSHLMVVVGPRRVQLQLRQHVQKEV